LGDAVPESRPRIYACHVKNIVIRRGMPLRMMEPAWPRRAMQFVDISTGELNMTRYVELLVQAGYPQRYCSIMKTKTAPWWWSGERLPRPGCGQRGRDRLRARPALFPAGARLL